MLFILLDQGFNARQIGLGIDSGGEHFWCQGHGDALAGFKHTQLFKRFDPLQRPDRHCDIAAQESGAIAIDADMAQEAETLGQAVRCSVWGGALPWWLWRVSWPQKPG